MAFSRDSPCRDGPCNAPIFIEHAAPLRTSLGLPTTYADEQQRMKERMGSIVRAKEGKMVNVNARLPFNLHNHPHPTGSIHANPSSSSSLSLSSSSRSFSAAGLAAIPTLSQTSGTPHTHAQVQVHVGAPLPGPSNLSRNTPYHRDTAEFSRSSSAASRDPSASASDDGSLARNRRTPILGLRLVRVPFPDAAGVGRRGRKKRKTSAEEGVSPQAGHPSESVGMSASVMGAPMDMGAGEEEQGTPRPRHTSHRPVSGEGGSVVHLPADGGASPPSLSGSESEMTPRMEHPQAWAISVSPASEADAGGSSAGTGKSIEGPAAFVLKDEGPLTVSWGD
ncbi:hypothetical protein BDN70DRAFT_930365 [Pholiota conissans]|uniref:Uncharacterized protein n=1 Tax=Pholiota conissans TaxID=109636 RepID=A0A9P5Z6Q1_9AGAR|nr:hypothetical protein BDN70DRAFT_930365 [Pholiota conissans]